MKPYLVRASTRVTTTARGRRHAEQIYSDLAVIWEQKRLSLDTRSKNDGSLVCWFECLRWILDKGTDETSYRIALLSVPNSLRVLHAVVLKRNALIFDPVNPKGDFDADTLIYTSSENARQLKGAKMQTIATVGFVDDSAPIYTPLY